MMNSLVNFLNNALIKQSHIGLATNSKEFIIENCDDENSLQNILVKYDIKEENIFVFCFDTGNLKKRKISNFITSKYSEKRCDGVIYYKKEEIHYFILC